MKKIILIILIGFAFIENASATTIEEQLTELKTNLNTLQTEVNNLESTRLNKTYPVGSIYVSTAYSTTSQVSVALGGTWEVYGSGKTLVGVNASDANFNTVNKTGGSSTTTLSTTNLPSHTHSIPALSGTAASAGAHTHSIPSLSGTTSTKQLTGSFGSGDGSGIFWPSLTSGVFSNGGTASNDYYGWGEAEDRRGTIYFDASHNHTITTNASTSGSNGAHTHSVTINASTAGVTGSGTSFTNLQPYITVYMYRRTA